MSIANLSPLSAQWSMLSLADNDPFPAYEVLRERGPVIWDPGMNCWLVLSHELCKEVESDEGTYRIVVADAPPLSFEVKGGKTALSSLLGDDHTRMRRLYQKILGPSQMPKYREEHVVPVINDAIDRFADAGKAELVSQFSEVVPPRIMASMFGLPWQDDGLLAQMEQWHRDIVTWIGLGYPEEGGEATRKAKLASDELNDLFKPLVLARRDLRGDDVISQVWTHAPEYYGPVGVDEVMTIVRDIELAAGETTTNAIANLFYLFLTNPEIRDAASSDHEAGLNRCVEETLRFLGSAQWRYRVANRDLTLGGAAVKKNDKLCLVHAAANRDPEHYACPHSINLERKSPADHLAFNVGPRVCLGMWLARLKMRESMKAIMSRLPEVRLDPEKEAPHFRAFSHRSYGPLHVVF
ncbi:cytochrome P450 [Nocardia sp. NPDC059154]|uniref:cytochrome P450 n=2 Tax=unclassified Nocardia TaxID=2637762 RepID=UPI0036AAE921